MAHSQKKAKTVREEQFKQFVIFLFALVPLHAQAVDLPPLETLMSERTNWSADPTEVSYVEARCSSLHSTVGGYFSASGTTDQDARRAKSLQDSAKEFLLFAVVFDSNTKKPMSKQAFGDRIKTFMEFYTTTLLNNKQSLNNAFAGVMEKDLAWCKELQLVNAQISERLKK